MNPHLYWIVMEVSSQAAHIALRPLLVLEPELHGIEVPALLPHPLLGSTLTQHSQVLHRTGKNIIYIDTKNFIYELGNKIRYRYTKVILFYVLN